MDMNDQTDSNEPLYPSNEKWLYILLNLNK
jgi:hypothetical protein